jgi:hypothetical protein
MRPLKKKKKRMKQINERVGVGMIHMEKNKEKGKKI